MKLSKKIKCAVDSPAASGAGTISKMLANHYNLIYCDTGKIYRLLALELIKKKFNGKVKIKNLRKISRKINLKKLKNRNLLNDKVAFVASQIAKDLRVRKLVLKFQKNIAYNPPKKWNGSILDGRDIITKVVPDADFKFYITANIKTRTLRRYKELKRLNKIISYKEVLKSVKKRDKSDINRKISPLKKTKDSVLINTTNLSKRACFLKIKKIIDRKLNN